jgi:hypothetical protein
MDFFPKKAKKKNLHLILFGQHRKFQMIFSSVPQR